MALCQAHAAHTGATRLPAVDHRPGSECSLADGRTAADPACQPQHGQDQYGKRSPRTFGAAFLETVREFLLDHGSRAQATTSGAAIAGDNSHGAVLHADSVRYSTRRTFLGAH